MKILILSDTHGETSAAEALIRREHPDHVIHLGDCLRDAEDLTRRFPILPICAVPGNNDWFTDEPKEKAIRLGGTGICQEGIHRIGISVEGVKLLPQLLPVDGQDSHKVSHFKGIIGRIIAAVNQFVKIPPAAVAHQRTAR